MKTMRWIICVMLCVCMMPLSALADQLYLIPDSDSRYLTKAELYQWDRESLSYIFNEIFARHGYAFNPGGKYDNWFSAMPWYTPDDPDNHKTVMNRVSNLEWKNYYLIKEVIAEMDAMGYKSHDATKKCYRNITPPGSWYMTGFKLVNMKAGQRIPIYSAPSYSSWRGANGKALVSTDGAVWAAGWENGWLLMFYETNSGSIRVGYGNAADMSSKPKVNTQLMFDYIPVTVTANCTLTDDPLKTGTTITTLHAGANVTYLTTMINQYGMDWDYIETSVNGQTVRGFIQHGYCQIPETDVDYGSYK